ncbi:MAG: DUF177 domain-containing protein [Rhodospirillaceae bacterium]|nr:MAG: DUF177 domain-containing protein [Rhodospirillaceae bacterium]
MQSNDNIEFSRFITLDKISMTETGRHIAADAAERAALATRFDLLGLDRLEADLRLRRTGAKVIRLVGHLSADVVQSCVVSLNPVPARLDVDFEMFFSEDVGATEADLTVEYDQDDPPEPVQGGQIDLGEVVAEQLGLNLDPYPRASDAHLPAGWRTTTEAELEVARKEEKPNPFSILKQVKTPERKD